MNEATTRVQPYARWVGKARRGRWTWLAIVRSGLKLANKDAQSRFLLYSSLTFVAAVCGLFYSLDMVEQFIGQPPSEGIGGLIQSTLNFVRFALGIDLSGIQRLSELRPIIWRAVFMLAVNVQLFWVAITISRIGPGLIADDIKTRALPIYFAKPINPFTYLLGKWLVVATYIALLTLLPNVLALIFAVLLTGGLATTGATLSLALQLVVAGFGVMVLMGVVMLALSSLSADKRYVAVGWFAICILPVFAQRIVQKNLPDQTRGWLGSISLRDDVRVLTERLFGLRGALEQSGLSQEKFARGLLRPVDPWYPAFVLGALVMVSLVVCYRRVVKFSRSAASV